MRLWTVEGAEVLDLAVHIGVAIGVAIGAVIVAVLVATEVLVDTGPQGELFQPS